jgi:PTH1 family peptidyl-tRNA hydrolase
VSYLIVGLGNPGSAYKETRHNIGFKVLEALSSQKGWVFKSAPDLKGKLAQGTLGENQVLLLLPSTFMNLSGEAVRACIEKFKVPLDHLIIVSDDVALPLGAIRLRSKGSAGGHNGLKSIETHLGTQYYSRLKIGVGEPGERDLSDYVLDSFSLEERETVKESIKKALEVLDTWMEKGLPDAMQVANKRIKEEGEENE